MSIRIEFAMLLAGLAIACSHQQPTSETHAVPASAVAQPEAQTPGAQAQAAESVTGPEEKTADVSIPTPVSVKAVTGHEGPLAAARADLAKRLGVAEDEIAAREIKIEQWPNAGLGCPQPGMSYAAVITPGYRIVLEVKGKKYTYHTDSKTHAVLCE